jgi:hypothetical protein
VRFSWCAHTNSLEGSNYAARTSLPQYRVGTFTLEDHQDLAELVSRAKSKWVLTNGDHPKIRKLYSNFMIQRVRTHVTVSKIIGGKRPTFKQLIIRNYEPPEYIAALKAFAYQEGVPVSEYVREMVHDHILQREARFRETGARLRVLSNAVKPWVIAYHECVAVVAGLPGKESLTAI